MLSHLFWSLKGPLSYESWYITMSYLLQILEPCKNSRAYRPPNPWTMAILGLIAEIYVLPNLKMNLKFDIEVHITVLLDLAFQHGS